MSRLDSLWLKVHCMPAVAGKLSRVVHFHLRKIKVHRICILCFYFSVSDVINVVLARGGGEMCIPFSGAQSRQ